MTLSERFEQAFWRLIYPVFRYLQRPFRAFHKGRQPYRLGWLAKESSLYDLRAHLEQQGFGNHFVAWQDPGQVLSWRKFDGFGWQYHLRVFSDGEIRGHYERTPEAAPLKHFMEVNEQAHRQEFLNFLGKHVTQEPQHRQLRADPTATEPESQFRPS